METPILGPWILSRRGVIALVSFQRQPLQEDVKEAFKEQGEVVSVRMPRQDDRHKGTLESGFFHVFLVHFLVDEYGKKQMDLFFIGTSKAISSAVAYFSSGWGKTDSWTYCCFDLVCMAADSTIFLGQLRGHENHRFVSPSCTTLGQDHPALGWANRNTVSPSRSTSVPNPWEDVDSLVKT